MTINDLWHEVEVDQAAAALEGAKRQARKALSPKVSFLMEASTREAFEDRLSLIDGDIDRIVAETAGDGAHYALTRAAVIQDFHEMFRRGEARRRRDADARLARTAREMPPVVDEQVLVARREARNAKVAATVSYTNYTNMDSRFMRGYEKGDTLVRGYSGTIDALDSAADAIYMRHNRDDRPDGQMCPSLSIGDVINIDGKWTTVLDMGFGSVEVDPEDITTRSWLEVIREYKDKPRNAVKKAATQAEVDTWLAKQDPLFADWARPYATRMVYGPSYNRSIANNLPEAARAFQNEGGMAGKQFRYVRSQLDAALGSERGEAWYWDEAQGEYTQRLDGTLAAKKQAKFVVRQRGTMSGGQHSFDTRDEAQAKADALNEEHGTNDYIVSEENTAAKKRAAYFVVRREYDGVIEGPFKTEGEAKQALADYPDEYMVATSEQIGKESAKVVDVSDTEEGSIFHTDKGDFTLIYYPDQPREVAERERYYAENPEDYDEGWYPDFPGQRPPHRYRIIGPEGQEVTTFSASGDQAVSPYVDAWEQARRIIEREGKILSFKQAMPDEYGPTPEEIDSMWNANFWRGQADAARQADEARKRLWAWKGQEVTVVKGRKIPKGTTGIVFYSGEGQWGWRIGFKTADGQELWTNLSNVELTSELSSTSKLAIKGQFRIVESTGSSSGQPFFTLQYMGSEDSPGYGVWEDVTSNSDRSVLEAFIESPPDWWGKSALLWRSTGDIHTTEVGGFALTAVHDSIGAAWAITNLSGEVEHATGKSRDIEAAKLAMLKRADIFGQDPDIVNQAPTKKVKKKKKVTPDDEEVVEDPDAEDEVEDEVDEDVVEDDAEDMIPEVTDPEDQVESVDPMTLDVGDTVTVSYTMGTGETGEVEGVFVRNENDIVFFSGPNGEFGVAERDGVWIDSEGNQFSFSFGSPDVTGEIDPNADAGVPDNPATPAEEPPVADAEDEGDTEYAADDDKDPKKKKKNQPPWLKGKSTLTTMTGNSTMATPMNVTSVAYVSTPTTPIRSMAELVTAIGALSPNLDPEEVFELAKQAMAKSRESAGR